MHTAEWDVQTDPISHGLLPEGGKLGAAVLQPYIPRAMGCWVLLGLAEFRVGGARTVSRAGGAPRNKIFPFIGIPMFPEPLHPASQHSQSPNLP